MKGLWLPIILCLLFWAFVIAAFGDTTPVQIVEWNPLSDDVSVSRVTLNGTGWVSFSTTALRGRKEVNILNLSSSENIAFSGVSESTTIGRTIYPRQNVTLKASYDLNIYLSSSTVLVVEITEIR